MSSRPSQVVLLVGGDLLATARLERAAADAGAELRRASPEKMVEAIESELPDLLVLDLDRGRSDMLDSLAEARSRGLATGRVVGYFSHVDDSLRAQARAAGCRALPRGRFWSTLPEELRAPEAQA